jgi:hypothetical protein
MSDRYVAQYITGRTVGALHILAQRTCSTAALAQEDGPLSRVAVALDTAPADLLAGARVL